MNIIIMIITTCIVIIIDIYIYIERERERDMCIFKGKSQEIPTLPLTTGFGRFDTYVPQLIFIRIHQLFRILYTLC